MIPLEPWLDPPPDFERSTSANDHECQRCGSRGGRNLIARDALCWSCWAQHLAEQTGSPIPEPGRPGRTAREQPDGKEAAKSTR